jgi:hypothetical protein
MSRYVKPKCDAPTSLYFYQLRRIEKYNFHRNLAPIGGQFGSSLGSIQGVGGDLGGWVGARWATVAVWVPSLAIWGLSLIVGWVRSDGAFKNRFTEGERTGRNQVTLFVPS